MRPRQDGPEDDQVDLANLEIDEVDLQIIRLLRSDARRSARAIAREISMSPGAVTERLSRLEESGVIRGYHADVDPEALGYRMRVMIFIQLDVNVPRSDTLDFLVEMKEIIAMYFVTGRWDLVVLGRVRSQEHLDQGVLNRLRQCPGFVRSETTLILERHAPSAPSALARDAEIGF
jgi:DNA-binding Lrp family transcriptional regulator